MLLIWINLSVCLMSVVSWSESKKTGAKGRGFGEGLPAKPDVSVRLLNLMTGMANNTQR
mgnify:CR=1 FL=1